ncbi:hypothetical protein DPEC_G00227430 [Dallia pectoralis]|uniref:Uncharacterized protein n=1 Tax=Dallia pectoralis TaxID=75939 RepID=A0ACC2G0Y7_DALPE|nr:hypothetical protein DPEC_G00227430 [Dallia pectoralis]
MAGLVQQPHPLDFGLPGPCPGCALPVSKPVEWGVALSAVAAGLPAVLLGHVTQAQEPIRIENVTGCSSQPGNLRTHTRLFLSQCRTS